MPSVDASSDSGDKAQRREERPYVLIFKEDIPECHESFLIRMRKRFHSLSHMFRHRDREVPLSYVIIQHIEIVTDVCEEDGKIIQIIRDDCAQILTGQKKPGLEIQHGLKSVNKHERITAGDVLFLQGPVVLQVPVKSGREDCVVVHPLTLSVGTDMKLLSYPLFLKPEGNFIPVR